MAPREDLMVFLDLECTGTERWQSVVEIGMVAVSLPDFTEASSFSCIIQPDPTDWLDMEPVVVEMHRKSGLAKDIEAHKGVGGVDEAEHLALAWLLPLLGKDTSHVYLGGSGIDHYDRSFLERDFNRLLKRFTYYSLDAGGLRRAFRRAGIPWLPGATEDTKAHRALDDARLHAREYAYAIEVLKQHPLAVGPQDVGSSHS